MKISIVKIVFTFLLFIFSSLLFAQQYPSCIITYRGEIVFDPSLNDRNASVKVKSDLPKWRSQEMKRSFTHICKTIKYLYFTPTVTWSYFLIDMEIPKKRSYSATVMRSYKDSTHTHSLERGIYRDSIGEPVFPLEDAGLSTDLQRKEMNKLQKYQRTEDTCQVLGHTCYAYRHIEDSLQALWVTEELDLPPLLQSSFIHPESEIEGVVLRADYGFGYLEASNIEFRELNETVLKYTPLKALRPEIIFQLK